MLLVDSQTILLFVLYLLALQEVLAVLVVLVVQEYPELLLDQVHHLFPKTNTCIWHYAYY